MEIVRNFSKLNKKDVTLAGGKGASLGEMTQAGIPVPEGYVILSGAFEQFIKETDLNVEIDAILETVKHEEVHTVEEASEKIQSLIINSEIPKNIEKEILSSFEKLGAEFVAVRSSATSEDSASAAWAGQLDTFLNTTKDSLLENVRKCWASLFTPRAIFYRFEKDLHGTSISVAVVVQKMIGSEESGIAFSVHPVTEDPNQLIIEAGFGLGEAIVSGQITPDSYVVDKQDWHIIDINVNEQEKGLYKKEGGGNEWKDLKEKGKEQVLNEKEIIELSKLIIKIENHYGFPCDIEWAKEKGKFYITQSRPITTLSDNMGVSTKEDYVFIYRFKKLPYLISDFLMQAYTKYNPFYCYVNNFWYSYFPKESYEKSLNEGLENIRDKKWIEKFEKEYNNLVSKAKYFEKELQKKEKLNKEGIGEFLDYLTSLLTYYSPLEHFSTDKAFAESEKDKSLKPSVEKMGQLKFFFREKLNEIALYPESLLKKYLQKIEMGYSVPLEVLYLYSVKEIKQIPEGFNLSESEIQNRSMKYAMIYEENQSTYYSGENADKLIGEIHEEPSSEDMLKGIPANKGKITAKARVLEYTLDDFGKTEGLIKSMQKGEILVTETTGPEIMEACNRAVAIVTDEGGLLSHAAIISRELKIPCVVGTKFATSMIKTGDLVEVDGEKGIVKVLEKEKTIVEELGHLDAPLIAGQLLYECETRRETPWLDEPFTIWPYWYIIRKDNLLYLYFDPEGKNWKVNKTGNVDPKTMEKETLKRWEKIKEIIESESALDKEEFKIFLENVKDAWPWLECMFWMAEYYEKNNKPLDDVIKVRKETEYFAPGLFATIRNSIKKILPKYKKYADVLLLEEVLSGKVPEEKILEKRMRGLFYTNNKLYDNLEEVTKEFNIELEKHNQDGSELKGQTVYKGLVKGKVRIIERREQISEFKQGEILVASTTTPDYLPAMKKAGAVISEHGGAVCHAAITSRELKIPCVVGVRGATKLLKDGDEVEVNANQGIVKLIKRNKKSTDYIRMFEVEGLPLLINTIAFEHYIRLEVIAIFRDNLWTTFMPKRSEEKTLEEGKKLFGDKEKFELYKKEFEDYKKRSREYLDSISSKSKISLDELKKSFKLIAEHWKYYQKTEFFYVDEAFKESKDNKIAKDNLKELEDIKNNGRVHLNSLIFGNSSYLSKIISIVSKQFNEKIEDLFFYTVEEIFDLYDNNIKLSDKIKKRKDSYSYFAENGKVNVLEGQESKEFIESFLVTNMSADEIKGIIANSGKARGRAKVIAVHYNDFDKLHEKIDSMNKGDVLIAETTSPELMTACKKASAIVTNQGGLLSHAAIVSRELGIPCLVGTEVAVDIIRDGDLIEVDADKGILKILKEN